VKDIVNNANLINLYYLSDAVTQCSRNIIPTTEINNNIYIYSAIEIMWTVDVGKI